MRFQEAEVSYVFPENRASPAAFFGFVRVKRLRHVRNHARPLFSDSPAQNRVRAMED